MKSEYLFSKEGSDDEIERMEALLSVYRIESVAPALQRAAVAEEHSTRPGFRFLFAYIGVIGSLAVVAIIFISVLTWQDGKSVDVTAISPAVVISPVTAGDDSVSEYPSGESIAVPAQTTPGSDRPAAIRAAYARSSRSVSKFQRRVSTAPKLTAEERYAYEQVKVALFLAGSKLKVVQDTIDRTDDNAKNSVTDKR
jgi:hypothetical protein